MMPDPTPSVLHVVSTPERRGGQVFAADLVRALNRQGIPQRVGILRAGRGPGTSFDAPVEVLGDERTGRLRPGILRALRTLAKGSGVQVLQAHGGEALKYGVVALMGLGIPIVYRRIGSTPRWASSRSQRVLYGSLARQAAIVIAVSDATRTETIQAFRVDPKRIVTVHNAVDVSRITPRNPRERVRGEIGIGRDAIVIASVSALTWEKDPIGQFDVVADVMSRIPEAVFVVAGDGPLRPALMAAIDRAGLTSRVRMLGVREDVPDILGASEVLLLASATEGMPAVAIEAGFVGIPVASYAVGGIPEVVLDGRTGVLARPGDRNELSHRLARLLQDPATMRSMGQAALQRCHASFEIGVIAPRYLELYAGLLDGSWSMAGRTT